MSEIDLYETWKVNKDIIVAKKDRFKHKERRSIKKEQQRFKIELFLAGNKMAKLMGVRGEYLTPVVHIDNLEIIKG